MHPLSLIHPRSAIVGRSIISAALLFVVCLVYVDRGLSRYATRDGDHMSIFIMIKHSTWAWNLDLRIATASAIQRLCIINRESGGRKDSRTRMALSLMY